MRARLRILLADDNADMRDYVRRLLAEQYLVKAVADGETALAAARKRLPDLVLTDVMMPRLDGFGFLRELRADPLTRSLPVIMLSARAGEESRVEGLKAGADDYLTKPFSAQELLARVQAHLQLAKLRREAQEAVRRSEEYLRAVVETTPACIKVVAADGTVVDMNSAGLAMVDAERLEQVRGTCAFNLIAPEHQDAFKAFHKRTCLGETGCLEFEIVGLRGTRRRVETHAAPLRAPDGRYMQLAITHDITERKQSEQQALHRAQQFETLFNAAPLGIYLVDADFRIAQVNPVALPVFGDIPGGVLGRDFDQIIHMLWEKEYADEVVRIFRHTLETGESFFTPERAEFRADRKVTEYYEWRLDRITLPDGRYGLVCYFRDISAQVRAREELARSELRWRTMTEALPNLVWTDLPNGECDWLSSQWGKYTGIPEQELLGLNWLDKVIHPDDRERTLACWQAACADKADYDLEYRIRRYDGEYHWFKTRGVPVRDAQGKIIYWFGTCTDIEDVKRLEASLREADRRKDEFLATLAHELRNPLAPIRNGLQLIRLAGKNPALLDQARTMMERQVQQLIRLVDDLLDVSRITRNKLELRKEWVELSAVVKSAVETSRPLIDAAQHQLTITLPAEPVLLDADPVRLAQAFSNLLNNAAKYSDRGGCIWLTAELASREQQPSGEVVVRVRDTGIGIPADKQKDIFDMFIQVDRSLERSQGGLGIGLTLVQRLIQMHGGSIEVHSEGPGKGSEFIVRLPVVAVSKLPSVPEPPDSLPMKAEVRRRILVVDDNRDAAESLAITLRLLGHEVAMAHDGLQAVETVSTFQPDVALLDLGMPKLNGYDAARRIRDQWGKSLLLIALTGWGQEEDRRRSHEAGFDNHMVKPVDPQGLMKLLAELQMVNA